MTPTYSLELIGAAEFKLLNDVTHNELHILRPLFPPKVQCSIALRPIAHNFTLPLKDSANFISQICTDIAVACFHNC